VREVRKGREVKEKTVTKKRGREERKKREKEKEEREKEREGEREKERERERRFETREIRIYSSISSTLHLKDKEE